MACAYSWNTKVSEDNGKTPVDTFFPVEFNNVKRKEPSISSLSPNLYLFDFGVKWCYFRLEISDSV